MRAAGEIAVPSIVGSVLLVEVNLMSLVAQALDDGAIGRGMSVSPGRGNREPEDGDLHPLLQPSGRYSSAGPQNGPHGKDNVLTFGEMHSAPSRWLGELDDVIRRGRIGAPGRSRTGDTSFAGSCLSHLATGAQYWSLSLALGEGCKLLGKATSLKPVILSLAVRRRISDDASPFNASLMAPSPRTICFFAESLASAV